MTTQYQYDTASSLDGFIYPAFIAEMGARGSVTLGRGKPLFPRRLTSPPLTLVSARQMSPGVADQRYLAAAVFERVVTP